MLPSFIMLPRLLWIVALLFPAGRYGTLPTAGQIVDTQIPELSVIDESKWNPNWQKEIVESYLLHGEFASGGNKSSVNFIRNLLKVIHHNQHPSKNDCRKKRLLVMHMKTLSLEGTGSILKQILSGLAVAMHSNRTLVWGMAPPYFFEHTRDIWYGRGKNVTVDLGAYSDINSQSTKSSSHRISQQLDCSSWHDPGGGPFECFFESISSCSLKDATPDEITQFSKNPFDESGRIMLSNVPNSVAKSIALYHPPLGLFGSVVSVGSIDEYDDDFRRTTLIQNASHLWSSAVTAYIFRLKPDVINAFKLRSIMRRQEMLFKSNWHRTWGVHIRHGDVHAHRIKFKRTFDIPDYFNAVRDMSHIREQIPQFVFVATDSKKAWSIPIIFDSFLDSSYAKKSHGMSPDSNEELKIQNEIFTNESLWFSSYNYSSDAWYREEVDLQTSELKSRPKLVFDLNKYRTAHGFLPSAGSGCIRKTANSEEGLCALGYKDWESYEHDELHDNTTRAARLMRVMLEGIEDMFLLSMCDSLIAQGSSHFSSIPAMLMWARVGFSSMDKPEERLLLLDGDTIITGSTQTAHLHNWSTKQGNDIDPGIQRWDLHTRQFLSSLDLDFPSIVNIDLSYNPFAVENRIRIEKHLPHMLEKAFYREVSLWLGAQPYTPVWPGNCPTKLNQMPIDRNIYEYAIDVINLGVWHLENLHSSQSNICFREAKRICKHYKKYMHENNFNGLSQEHKDIVEKKFKELRNVAIDHLEITNAAAKIYSSMVTTKTFRRGPAKKVVEFYLFPIDDKLDEMYKMNELYRERFSESDLSGNLN